VPLWRGNHVPKPGADDNSNSHFCLALPFRFISRTGVIDLKVGWSPQESDRTIKAWLDGDDQVRCGHAVVFKLVADSGLCPHFQF
jgi:hypothetical protein